MGRLSWLQGILRVNVVRAEAASGADTKALQHLPAVGGAMGSSLVLWQARPTSSPAGCLSRAEAAPNTPHIRFAPWRQPGSANHCQRLVRRCETPVNMRSQSRLQWWLLRTVFLHRALTRCPHCPSAAAADRSQTCSLTRCLTFTRVFSSQSLIEGLQANGRCSQHLFTALGWLRCRVAARLATR
jgi:hypothetical protein